MIPGLSTAKLIGLAIAAAAILSFVLLAFHWRDTMTERGKELATICTATRAAADNPKMDCKLTAPQIGEMGKSIADLKAGIAHQNAAVSQMAAESAKAQDEAKKAVLSAVQRVKSAQASSARLAASSRSVDRKTAPCTPSKELERAWQ